MKAKNKVLRDVMTRGVVTVSMSVSMKEVASIMAREDISGVAVVSPDGEVVGVISEMDILKIVGNKDWKSLPAECVMTPRIESIRPDTTLDEAAKIMQKKHVHRLLVLSERGVGASERPVGIVSASDIVREVAKEISWD